MKTACVLATLLLAGCAKHQPTSDPAPRVIVPVGALIGDSIANDLITRALTADAASQNPDSIYGDDAEIVANGEIRTAAPRLAGVGSGGRLLLGSSQMRVATGFVWGSIEYRWVPGRPDEVATSGYATLIVSQLRDGRWRVVHLHSSTVPSPETTKPARSDTTGRAGP